MRPFLAIFFCMMLMMLFASPVFAQDKLSSDETLVDLCGISERFVMMHQPEADVTHIPDADVHHGGVAVMNNVIPSEKITIPITIDALERAGIVIAEGVEANALISTLDIYMNGRVLYNGQEITSQLDQACKQKEKDQTLDQMKEE